MRCIPLFVCFLLTTLASAPAFSQQFYPPPPAPYSDARGKLKVAVADYRITGYPAYFPSRLGAVVANSVQQALDKSGRFTVYQTTSYTPQYQPPVYYGAGLNPSSQPRINAPAGAEYLLSGEIEFVLCDVTREYSSYDHDHHRRRDYRYRAEVEVQVRHVAVDVRTGQIWREVREEGKASGTFDRRPSYRKLDRLFESATNKFGIDFVRQLVRPVEGAVVRKDNRYVLVNLGSNHGVGYDTDIRFYRRSEVGNGQYALMSESTPAVQILPLQIAPSRKHEDNFVVVGRPVKNQIGPEYSVIEVGYYGGSFFHDVKWKNNPNSFAAVRPDDIAVLSPRPEGAK